MYRALFTPFRLNSLELPNRLVMAPMVTCFCNEDGTATEQYIAYHEARAKGGWGLIITENYAVAPEGKAFRRLPGLWDDSQIESHAELTRRVHAAGGRIAAQMYHCGMRTTRTKLGGLEPVGPSPIELTSAQDLPRELSREQIKIIVGQHGDAAARAKEAGFDAVEIIAAVYYLIGQFLSPFFNKRTDEYGGSFNNRMRLLLEIVADIRSKVGPDFPLMFRIAADEMLPGGRSLEETKVVCHFMELAGVDAIDVREGIVASPEVTVYRGVPPMQLPHGWMVGATGEIKNTVNVAVIANGRINEPLLADSIIASGKADLVSMGRAALADPDFPRKAMAGDLNSIRHCLGCMQGCMRHSIKEEPVMCLVNPEVGRESQPGIHAGPSDTPGVVAIAGAGPAGMEAARVAASRGHQVHLYEKTDRMGGQFEPASVPPFKGELADFIAWERNELKKLGVQVHLNTELTRSLVQALQPIAVVVATGSTPAIPDIPGITGPNVVSAADVLMGRAKPGRRCLVAGGGMVGAETAGFLATRERDVTVVDMLPRIADDLDDGSRAYLIALLDKWKVEQLVDTRIVEVTEAGVRLETDGRADFRAVDTVVLALGMKPERSLSDDLAGLDTRVLVIGDAAEPRTALEAVREGFEVALGL